MRCKSPRNAPVSLVIQWNHSLDQLSVTLTLHPHAQPADSVDGNCTRNPSRAALSPFASEMSGTLPRHAGSRFVLNPENMKYRSDERLQQ